MAERTRIRNRGPGAVDGATGGVGGGSSASGSVCGWSPESLLSPWRSVVESVVVVGGGSVIVVGSVVVVVGSVVGVDVSVVVEVVGSDDVVVASGGWIASTSVAVSSDAVGAEYSAWVSSRPLRVDEELPPPLLGPLDGEGPELLVTY